MNKSWFYVAMTSFFELVWIYGFNVASAWWHWIFIVLFIAIDFHFLTKACENLPTGTVYAIFAGIGTVGTALMDVFFFGQSLSAGKIFFIAVLVIGVISLKLADDREERKNSEGNCVIMGWLYVLLAAISEIIGVVGLKKYSQKKTANSGLLYVGGFGASFAFLYMSFKYLQVSVAYAVWIGIGTAGAVLINMFFFGESKSTGRMVSVMLIVAGVVGLKALS